MKCLYLYIGISIIIVLQILIFIAYRSLADEKVDLEPREELIDGKPVRRAICPECKTIIRYPSNETNIKTLCKCPKCNNIVEVVFK